MQFKNLRAAAVSPQATAKFTFYSIEGEPWLMVRPAHEVNSPFWNALLKRNAGDRGRRLMAQRQVTASTLKHDRDEARELYGKYVANAGSWGGWVDETTGTEVPYSQSAVEDLMKGLPDDQFDELRQYCQNLSNFRADVVGADEAEATGKNSQTG